MFRPLVCTLAVSVPALHAAAPLPLPASMKTAEGTFAFAADDRIQVSGAETAVEAGKFAASLRPATGFKLPVGQEAGRIRFSIDPSLAPSCGEEGYHLKVTPEAIQLAAATSAGLYHGAQTLRQLLPTAAFAGERRAGVEWSVGAVTIADRPRFGWRGFMLDESRHFFGPEYVKHLLDAMAARKLNVFHWHLSDDDGWRVEIKSWPKLTETGAWRGTECKLPNTRPGETHKRYGGFYTQDQIREIVAYAAERHIDIMPEFDFPGHCLALATAYPETLPTVFDESVSAQGVKANAISPAREENYRMVDDIIREISALFPFRYIHVGGDEVNHSLWSKCPEIKKLMEREKIGSVSGAQGYFTRRLEKIIDSHGKRMIGWNEILGGGQLRPDTTVMSWTGTGPGFDAARRGHPVVMAAGQYSYFDMSYGGPDEPKSHWWAGEVDTSKTYSFDPLAGGNLTADQEKLVLGPHSALWTEFIDTPEHADYKIFPRLNALAEVAWTPQELRSWDDFKTRLGDDLERLHLQGIAFRVPPPTAIWKQGFAKVIPPFPGAEVRFTTDGSKPTADSPRYETPVKIEDPSGLKYLTIFHGRTSPARSGAEREAVAKWSPKEVAKDWKAAEFDVTPAVTADGIHRAIFQFTGGAHKLRMRQVELVRDGKVIATDGHEGETGGRSSKNVYRLPVTGHRPGARYTLRAEMRGDGGNDSHGGIALERSLWLEPGFKVETSIPAYGENTAESLATWNPDAKFWSSRPLGEKDAVTFVFDQPLALKHVELPTGEASGTKDQIQNAVLEVSADGKDFRKVADFTYGSAKADLDGRPVRAIRMRVTGSHPGWCIVRAPQLR